MKKEYSTPEIIFESFALTTSIAGGCEYKTNTPSSGTCGYPYEGGNGDKLFTGLVDDCDIPIDDNENNGFCYHVPVESMNIFNS